MKKFLNFIILTFFFLVSNLIFSEEPNKNLSDQKNELKNKKSLENLKLVILHDKNDTEILLEQLSKDLPELKETPSCDYGSDPNHISSREAYNLIYQQSRSLREMNLYQQQAPNLRNANPFR